MTLMFPTWKKKFQLMCLPEQEVVVVLKLQLNITSMNRMRMTSTESFVVIKNDFKTASRAK